MALEYTKIPATELRQHGSDIVNRVAFGNEEVVLTRRGKPVAALISLAALEALHRLEDAQDIEEAAVARKDARRYGTTPWRDVKAELHRRS